MTEIFSHSLIGRADIKSVVQGAVMLLALLATSGVPATPNIKGNQGDVLPQYRKEPIQPIPLGIHEDPKKVELGRRLFHDTQLSGDNTISCASCHPLERAGVDGLKRSIGVGGAVGNINAPTVFNSRFNFKQFWDGRAESLEEQVDGPVNNPQEMASNWEQVIGRLSEDSGYLPLFKASYGGEITAETIKNAIATFERTLITPNARFDQFLRGDETAMSEFEKQGYLLFKSYGCSVCHQGVAAGGNLFEKMGVMLDYFSDRGHIKTIDYGRFNVTGNEEDRFSFKVPSLRNVALTAPYFHDGTALTLQSAVSAMAKYQLGRPMSVIDMKKIVAFLKTLTGDFPRLDQ